MWITSDSLYIANETRVPASYAKHDETRRPSQIRYERATAIGDLIADAIIAGVGLVRTAAMHIREWQSRASSYRALSAMSSRDLSDMGISRGDIPFVLSGTFVRGGWKNETSNVFDGNLPTASNDAGHPAPARRRHRS